MTLRQQQLEVNMPLRRLDIAGRLGAPGADLQQPAGQRDQVHPKERQHPAGRRGHGGCGGASPSLTAAWGITPQALPTIFDPFVRGVTAIAVDGAGLGIGLTVVRELVESHGGTVVAASAGQGPGQSVHRDLAAGASRRCRRSARGRRGQRGASRRLTASLERLPRSADS